jgi:hypothetical protein
MKERRKPISQRITIEVDGEAKRLGWVAENKPEILAKLVLGGVFLDQLGNMVDAGSAWSALYQHGWTRESLLDKCKDWGLDAGILGYVDE